MKISDFDFHLPPNLIAQEPYNPRDGAKLLSVGSTLEDKLITDLLGILSAGDMLVFNDTKVIPCRLNGQQNNLNFEITLHKPVSSDEWLAFAKPTRKLEVGKIIKFSQDFEAMLIKKRVEGDIQLKFEIGKTELFEKLKQYGSVPLPPYIKRPKGITFKDKTDYQTLFALHEGAVAAPTAGLHFTQQLLSKLSAKGILFNFVTLHVGAGTFLPVRVDNIEKHEMHSEWGEVKENVAASINRTKNSGGNIIPVGTTSLRLLETAATPNGQVSAFSGETNIFITPGYEFKVTDKLITNFHLPKSTLFMLVAAFSGLSQMHTAYKHAIKNQYRFYSYGDACLLNKQKVK